MAKDEDAKVIAEAWVPRDRMRRLGSLALVALVHSLLLIWLISLSTTGPIIRNTNSGLITIALDDGGGGAAQPKDEPAPTSAKAVSRPPVPPPPIAAPVFPQVAGAAVIPVGAGASAGGCALALQTAAAIGRDTAAMAELDALPSGSRTSADAVMLWDGQWLQAGIAMQGRSAPSPRPAEALRAAVELVIRASTPACRDAEVSGPQFVPVADAGRTVMIVIGSGRWHWADLLNLSRN